jgi:hypothetical protein
MLLHLLPFSPSFDHDSGLHDSVGSQTLHLLLKHNRPTASCTNLRSTDARMALAPMLCAGLVNQLQDYGICLWWSHCFFFEWRQSITLFITMKYLSITMLTPMLPNLANPHLHARCSDCTFIDSLPYTEYAAHSASTCAAQCALPASDA